MDAQSPHSDPSTIFTHRFDRRIRALVMVVLFSGAIAGPVFAWLAWPDHARVGYRPEQPIDFSHQLHAGAMQIQCRYCHTQVDKGAHSTVPDLAICMNCHSVFKGDPDDKAQQARIQPLLDHWARREPVVWNQVYDLADFAFFDHSRHVGAGLDCRSCHGYVEGMARVEKVSPLTMGWCFRCHRGRGNPIYTPEAIAAQATPDEVDDPIYGRQLAPVHCSTCHR